MGRIRTIKPDFFLHEGLYDLECETGLPVRVAFSGLWTQADREGRFQWQPRRLKTQVLPYDELDFSRVLDALATRGFVQKYEVSGVFYGVIPGFSDHQVINNREADSKLPKPSDGAACDASFTRESRVQCVHERKGREGKGREGDKTLTSRDEPPDKFSEEDMALAHWIYERILDHAPKTKRPNLPAWADTIRLMRERDGHTHQEILEVFSYANTDSFWATNILSPAKLREKFSTLDAKLRRSHAEIRSGGNTGQAGQEPGRKLTPAERVRANQERARQRQNSGGSPDMGGVGEDGRDLRSQVGQPVRGLPN